jgi:hypothetical protein
MTSRAGPGFTADAVIMDFAAEKGLENRGLVLCSTPHHAQAHEKAWVKRR